MSDSEVRGNRKYKREQDELSRLEKDNRELKAVNRSLMRQIKKLAKGINKQEIEETLEELEEPNEQKQEKDQRRACPSCGRNGLYEIDLAGRRFERCKICDYKSGRIK